MRQFFALLLAAGMLLLFSVSASAAAPRPNALSELYSAEGTYTDSVGNTENYTFHVPQLNADTEAAAEINGEIRERFGAAVESQLTGMEEGYSLWCWRVEWHPYWHGDQLFLLVVSKMEAGFTDYAAYGYDFAGGERITNEKLLAELGVSEEEYLTNLREKVRLMFEDMYRDVPDDIREKAGLEKMLEDTLAWADMAQPAFIDGAGTVETVVKIASLAGAGWYYHLVTPFAYG